MKKKSKTVCLVSIEFLFYFLSYLLELTDAVQEEPKEKASPTSISPTDLTVALKEFMTAEKKANSTPSSGL